MGQRNMVTAIGNLPSHKKSLKGLKLVPGDTLLRGPETQILERMKQSLPFGIYLPMSI